MTAINYLSFDKGVLMFSDTAQYLDDLTITSFAVSKIWTPEGGKLGIITSGNADVGQAVKDFAEGMADGPLTFDRALEFVPQAMRLLEKEEDAGRIEAGRSRLRVALAGWSEERARWTGATFLPRETDRSKPLRMFVEPGRMWPPMGIEGSMRLMTEPEVEANLQELKIKGFVRTALNLQRRTALTWDRESKQHEMCVVGGHGEMVFIGEAGVRREFVETWADEAGDSQEVLRARVLSEPPMQFKVQMTRAERRRMARAA